MLRNLYRTIALLAALAILATPSFAGKKDQEMTIDIENADGENVSIAISSNLVDGIIKGLSDNDMECDTTTDKETLAMLQHLDRKGPGSKYTFTNDEGELVDVPAYSGEDELEFMIEQDGGLRIRIE